MGVKSLQFLTICSSRPQPSKRDAKRGVRSRSVLLQIAVDVVVVGGGGGCRRGVVGIIAVVAVGVVALPLSANPTGEDVCSKGVACRRLAPGAGWPSLGVSHLAPNLQVGEFGICKALSGNASVVVRLFDSHSSHCACFRPRPCVPLEEVEEYKQDHSISTKTA